MLKDEKEKSNDNTAFKTCPIPPISMKISRSGEKPALWEAVNNDNWRMDNKFYQDLKILNVNKDGAASLPRK